MVGNAFIPPGECPVCGEEVPGGARSCPSCGADENTGWNDDDTRYDGLDLPDDAFDDEVDRPPLPRKPWRQSSLWAGVALVLLILFMLWAFRA